MRCPWLWLIRAFHQEVELLLEILQFYQALNTCYWTFLLKIFEQDSRHGQEFIIPLDNSLVFTHLVIFQHHELQDLLLFLLGREVSIVSNLVILVDIPIDSIPHHLLYFL